MDSKILIPLGLGAVALALVFSGSKSSAKTPGGQVVTGDQLDQAFVDGLVAQLNQCYEDGEITEPVAESESVVGAAVANAAALAQSYIDAVMCASRYVDQLGMPEGPDLQKVREDAGTITRAWIRNLRGAEPLGSVPEQADAARAEATSEGYDPASLRNSLLNLLPFGIGQLASAAILYWTLERNDGPRAEA